MTTTPVERAFRGAKSDARLYVLSVFSVAVAFVCLAATLLVVVNVQGLRDRWGSTGRASVFLKANATDAQVAELDAALRKTAGIVKVRRVTSEETRHEIAGSGVDPVLDALPAEAFPASIELELDQSLSRQRLEKLKAQLGVLPQVDAVQTYEAWSERLGSLLSRGVAAAGLLALIVLASVVSVVSSTLRLSLERRRIEVEVLKLVGATDAYVRRPFVVEGAAQGLFGSVFALAFLFAVYLVLRENADPSLFTLLGLTPSFLPWHTSLSLVLAGSFVGAASALLSLRKLLSV
jgi:cell division transport system permease protein